ncbi:serine hydrolase [Shewanella sp. Scap07]|uniref:serine hydrolase domain-containing protein n=1 Tax=Shewanella sp. Scap07 TaxID=2589987 RepID=UPI0015BFE3B2|nr:serine hydrolase [Shewanella sp. Scap07]QLE85709.1 serine hydrolase [Shewanella sp. Scap07]
MRFGLSIIASILFAGTSYASNDFSAIDKYVNFVKKEVGLPSGTAVAIVKDGKIVYEGYFGYSNLKDNKRVTEKTAFYLASVTKPMFALSVLLMEGNGDIKDSTSMAEMFPTLEFPYIDTDKIQVKHLVSHTHALANIPLVDTLAFTGQHNKLQRQKLTSASKNDPANQLGHYQYGNEGYNILSVWAEDKFKQDWQQTLEQLVYQPLSMNHTSSYVSDAETKGFDIARPYHLYAATPKKVMPFEKSDSTMQAAGGTFSSARDMAKFLIAQLNEGQVNGKQVFPANVIKKSHQKLATNDLKYRDFIRKGYAWGWYMGPYKEEKTYHHFGGIAGTHTHASFMLEHNIGLIVLNNEETVAASMTQGIADIAYSILLGKGDVNKITESRIEAMKDRWLKIQADIKETNETHEKRNAARKMVLTREKSEYAGVFHNPLWGNLEVELLENNDLKFSLGELNAVATAAKRKDELRIQFQIGSGRIAAYKIVEGKVAEIDVYGINPLAVETFTRL